MNCCTGDCREGRDCPLSAEATRRALRMTHVRDGGHRVSGDDSLRLDAPLITPEAAEAWTTPALFFLAIVVFALLAAAVNAFYQA